MFSYDFVGHFQVALAGCKQRCDRWGENALLKLTGVLLVRLFRDLIVLAVYLFSSNMFTEK